MLHLIINFKKVLPWWKVRTDDQGNTKQYSFVLPMLLVWLRSLLKGRR